MKKEKIIITDDGRYYPITPEEYLKRIKTQPCSSKSHPKR